MDLCVVSGGSSLVKAELDSGFLSADAAVACGLPDGEPESLATESLADAPNPEGRAAEVAGVEPHRKNPGDTVEALVVGVPKENFKPASVELLSAFCGKSSLKPPGEASSRLESLWVTPPSLNPLGGASSRLESLWVTSSLNPPGG